MSEVDESVDNMMMRGSVNRQSEISQNKRMTNKNESGVTVLRGSVLLRDSVNDNYLAASPRMMRKLASSDV